MENITPQGRPPENHLVWAILTTVMCCLPLGIVSIIKAAKVKKLWALGDTESAQKSADDAKKYSIWSAVSFPIILVVLFMIMKYILESQVLC
jgi:hypothetical protein